MARRQIGQEVFTFVADPTPHRCSLDRLLGLIDWSSLDRHLAGIYTATKGELAWPPSALFRALLLAVWYDLSDLNLAEALEDRASFRRELVRRGLDKIPFDEVTRQLKAQAVTIKKGTLVDATVISSASTRDEEAAWAGHKHRKAIHGFKAHVAADADTALVEEVTVTPGNVNDGRAGGEALPENLGDVYADSAYCGTAFASAVQSKGGCPRVVQTGVWERLGGNALRKLRAWNHHVQLVRCRIEKIFGTWKRSYGLRRMRWLGLAKAVLQVRLTAWPTT
jgi:IS5 family transposase